MKAPDIPAPPSVEGAEDFGVPRRPSWIPARSGRASLVALDDVDAALLVAGDLLVALGGHGFRPVYVAQVRESATGEIGVQVECLVIDARTRDGQCLTYAPCDLFYVQTRGQVGT